MKSIWTALHTTVEVERCLDELFEKSERSNEFGSIPHNFRKKQSIWFRLSHKRQLQFIRSWIKGLKKLIDKARCGRIKFTLVELQNLEHEDIVQLRHYVDAKITPPSSARLDMHQTIRGRGSFSLDSRHFMLCCVCLGPEETRRVIAEAKRFKIKPIRRVAGCVFTGKRR